MSSPCSVGKTDERILMRKEKEEEPLPTPVSPALSLLLSPSLRSSLQMSQARMRGEVIELSLYSV